MRLTKKTLALLLAMVMLFGGVIGGTVAWLVSTTDIVTNTFTVGNINITLTETGTTSGNGVNTKEYKMIPGTVLDKDPKVTVEVDSEACYVFLKVTENHNTSPAFIKYEIDDTNWTSLTGVDDVYYKTIENYVTSDIELPILEAGSYMDSDSRNHPWGANQVLVNPDITKAQMDVVGTNTPSLTFKACAVQKDQLTLEQAWTQAQSKFS